MNKETLERRQLLAGDLALAHNYWAAHDVDDNLEITAKDALTVINHLQRTGGDQQITEADQVTSFVDVNADHHVTAADALSVINALNRGEGQVDELIELMLTARDQNDNEIAPDGDGDIPVTVGETFNLEVSYRDLREDGNDGALKLRTDITFDPSSPITPVTWEAMSLRITGELDDTSGSITFALEDDPDNEVVVNIDDYSASSVASAVESALSDFGYTDDQFEVDAERVPVEGDSEEEIYIVELRYRGESLMRQDLPQLLVDVSAPNPATVESTEIDPLNPDGTVNSNAIRWALDFHSRTFLTGGDYYGDQFFGAYSEEEGLDDIGGTSFDNFGSIIDFSQPFDAFSVPMMITEPVEGLVAALDPADVTEGILLFNRDTPVPDELILLDDESQLSITATEVIEGPQASDGTLTTDEDTAETIDLAELVEVVSGGPASFAITTEPSRGNASVDGSMLTYTPDPDEFGSDTVVYTATNSEGSSSGTINVTIDPVNDPPVANADTATTQEDAPVDIDVLENDETGADNEDDPLSVQDATDGDNGSVEINGDGTVTYTPDPGFVGTDSFTYTLFDGEDTDTGTVNVTVEEAPDVISADDDELNIDEDATEPVTVDLQGLVQVISGDQELSFDILTNGSRGTASLDGSELSYLPDPDKFGSDTVIYQASNNEGSDTGTITITISAENDPPVANPDTASTIEDTPVEIDVLDNDSPGPNEDDSLEVSAVADGSNGTTTINTDGTVTYTPSDGFNGTDTFTYTVRDSGQPQLTATGTVTVTVTEVNDPPVANPDTATTEEDTSVNIDVVDNDTTGGEDDTLTVVGASDGENGTTTVESDNTITYSPESDFFGTDTFTYTLSDGPNTAQGTVTVTVTPVNDPPEAVDDTATAVKDTSVVIDVLENDNIGAPNEDDTLMISDVGDADDGTATIEDGVIVYTPDAGFVGTDTFTYTITDGTATAQATVSVNVQDFVPSTLSGSVFFDHVENIDEYINDGADPIRDGVQDAEEPGLSGTPVRLVSADTGELVDQDFTQLDGSYTFENVVPGNYRVVYDIPDTIVYGRDVGDAPGGPSDDGVIDVSIGQAGGVTRSGLNFTLLSTRGSSIDHVDLFASTYENSPDGLPHGGTVSLNDDGTQNWLKAEGDFGGVLFAELTFNQERDAALLTIVEEDGSVKTASLSEEQFVVSRDGSAAAFFGSRSSLDFADSADDLIRQEFENYRKTIDRILAELD